MKTDKAHATAINLMKLALPLLDKAGDTAAAARLQHAISTAQGEPAMQLGDELPPELLTQFLAGRPGD